MIAKTLRLVIAACLLTAAAVLALSQNAGIAALRDGFRNPPNDARIMMRWWWFGPAVSQNELDRELQVMKSAGIGGVEIQPVYPLELDDPAKNFHNQRYLSPEFLDAIRFTAQRAKQLGLRVDMTLGSGWPYGGPDTPVTEAAGRLRIDRIPVAANVHSLPLPALENGESLLAVFAAPGNERNFDTAHTERLTELHNGRVALPTSLSGPHVLLFFISSRTGQQVKRAAIGAEGFVLDHYNRAAIERHLTAVADPLLQAFGPNLPHAVFSDSLEVFASDWTPDFLTEFRKRRGYDLTPHLPELLGGGTAESASIRHDWGQTLTELAEENYLTPIREWAHRHHTLFRSQTYGEPPVIFSSNALVDLPEGEMGPKWRRFGTTRWASSADHLYGRNITSSETWTWLHAPSFRATPLDMKAEADLHFVEGINQLVGHGWPYSPPSAGEPGWRFYASAAFNDHNPWFQVMPEITRYLQRLSWLLRQGSPANDIAIYLPTDDAWAQFKPGQVSVDQLMDKLLGPSLIPAILNAGYNFDFVDDRAIATCALPYSAIILPGVERIPAATLHQLSAYVGNGGSVIATRRPVSLAPSQPRVRFLPDEGQLSSTLASVVPPDFETTPEAAPAIGFIHRTLPYADIYFVANTSNHNIDTDASVRVTQRSPKWWDPFTGESKPGANTPQGARTTVPLHLAPYESRVIVFSTDSPAQPPANRATAGNPNMDLSTGWTVTFPALHLTRQFDRLHSWTDDERTRFYSGPAIYEKEFNLASSFAGHEAMLDFGPGEPVPPPTEPVTGMRALLESPVRESALVYVNGQLAGSVWHPPYQLAISKALHPGSNRLRIVVANLAINELAGRALPDYRLLNLRYGERFVPQGFDNLKPLPAGILCPVTLHAQ